MLDTPRLEFVTCASPAGLHRMAYWEWGDPANDDVVLCVHGLTRTGRDFDELAQRLAPRFRVVCPDVAGRGESDWLVNPSFYAVPQYVSDMVALLDRLQPSTLRWVGTSMGGLIGMAFGGTLALSRMMRMARPRPGGLPPEAGLRIDRMVLNDVGPRLDPAALFRIGQYVGQPGSFATFAEAVRATRQVAETFGPHTDAQWETLTRRVYREVNGRWVKHYDAALAAPLAAQTQEAYSTGEQILWQSYEALDCPILIVRGAQSDLLSAATVAEMRARHPRAQAVEFPGVGHAPTLMTPAQIEPVAAFLEAERG